MCCYIYFFFLVIKIIKVIWYIKWITGYFNKKIIGKIRENILILKAEKREKIKFKDVCTGNLWFEVYFMRFEN